MDLWNLHPGDNISLKESGTIATVLTETEDGKWIKIRYKYSPESPKLVGTEDLCSADEIEDKVG